MQAMTKQMLKNELRFDIICGLYFLLGLLFKKKKDFFHKKEYNRFVKIIKKQYSKLCEDKIENENDEIPNRVFVMWFQGVESAPEIVKLCIKSIKKYFDGFEITVITNKNYGKYIDIPKHVREGFEKKEISVTHFSDYIRFALLSKWGGYWIDATCLMVDKPQIPKGVFYTLRHGKYANFHISSGKWSTFFMGSSKNSIVMSKGLKILDEHIKKYGYYPCYLFIDVIIKVLYQENKKIQFDIDKVPNSNSNVFELQRKIEAKRLNSFQIMEGDYVYKMNWRYGYSNDEIQYLKELAKLEEVS